MSVLFLWKPSKSFGEGGDLESCDDLSWEDTWEEFEDWSDCESDSRARVRLVPDGTDVLVSLSVITERCDVSFCCSEWEFVEPQSFSFSKKRAHSCAVSQEEMRHESAQVKAPPPSRRRMTPPSPLQNSYTSTGNLCSRFFSWQGV